MGYKYEQKLRKYITINNTSNLNSNTFCNTERTTERDTLCSAECNTIIIDNADKENWNFMGENIELLKELLLNYKRNKESNTNNNGIVIDLIDDKHKLFCITKKRILS